MTSAHDSMAAMCSTPRPACQISQSGSNAAFLYTSSALVSISVRVSVFVKELRSRKATSGCTLSPPASTCGVRITLELVPASLFVHTMSSALAVTIACLYAAVTWHSCVAMKRVPNCAPAYPASSARRNPAASPTPPAHTSGTSANPPVLSSCANRSAERLPVCPPIASLRQLRPLTPASHALRATSGVCTSWYTLMPWPSALLTIASGLPRLVRKNLTPSSIETSIHSSICLMYFLFGTMVKFTPNGRLVSLLIRRSPSRKSWPYNFVSEMGCTTPKPPASLTAATSSGFEPGYIGPLMMGTLAPVCSSSLRVAAVARTAIPPLSEGASGTSRLHRLSRKGGTRQLQPVASMADACAL
mmetsp:Transcript_48975/g.113222  ORF Transcript_48975/g.113222 Transcript_48975/m.113222 type:complete len:359 (+) Transcript_48975:442-1518(+)